QVLRLAGWLHDLGIRTGDRICIGMRNSVDHVTVLMASQVLGAVAVPFNIRLKPAGIDYIVRNSGARAVVLDDFVDLATTQNLNSDLEDLIWIDAGGDGQRGSSLAYDIFRSHEPLAELPHIEESDPSQIIYTSGTTGNPKGVSISQRATYQRLITYIMNVGPNFDRGTKTLGAAPLYHTVGIHWVYLQTLFVNGTYFP